MPSNPQQNHPGMESNGSIASDVPTMTGAGCTMAAIAIVGEDRRGGIAGVRGGRGSRATSCLAPAFGRPGVVSGLWGSTMLRGSFFDSAMTDHVAPRKIAENSFVVTLTFRACDFSTCSIGCLRPVSNYRRDVLPHVRFSGGPANSDLGRAEAAEARPSVSWGSAVFVRGACLASSHASKS